MFHCYHFERDLDDMSCMQYFMAAEAQGVAWPSKSMVLTMCKWVGSC